MNDEQKQKLLEQQKFNQRVALPFEDKLHLTKQRIKDWFEHWDGEVGLSYSGGKDSHVLLEIIQSMGKPYSDIAHCFSNTGLEMPEILKHVRKQKDRGVNIVEIKPKKTYQEVWKTEGIPLISKKSAKAIRTLKAGKTEKNKNVFKLYDEGITSTGKSSPRWKLAKKWRGLVTSDIKISEKCCDHLKKEPIKRFEKESGLKQITGMMASEGGSRAFMTQCNAFDAKRPTSSPMLFWTEEDVWQFIETYNIEICEVYYSRTYVDGEMIACDSPFVDLPSCEDVDTGSTLDGEKRTGCMFCAFGAHLEQGSKRFQRMSVRHPRQHAIVMDR
ncbi:MAG: phosphoadenosine phosphosulfate reductase family protein, partial [Alphaproteobacteria bacterium]|nr:phosphoadenosine phosphosulfate reductase family protein [Alphaproteobacteria bacterium]